jgi:hypothetical protein
MAPADEMMRAFHQQDRGNVEWEVQKRPDVLAYDAQVFFLDEVQLYTKH